MRHPTGGTYRIEGGVEAPYDGLWGAPNMVAWWKTSAAERQRARALQSGESVAGQADTIEGGVDAAGKETRDEL